MLQQQQHRNKSWPAWVTYRVHKQHNKYDHVFFSGYRYKIFSTHMLICLSVCLFVIGLLTLFKALLWQKILNNLLKAIWKKRVDNLYFTSLQCNRLEIIWEANFEHMKCTLHCQLWHVLLDSLKQTAPHADVLSSDNFALMITGENNHLWFTENSGNSLCPTQTLAEGC